METGLAHWGESRKLIPFFADVIAADIEVPGKNVNRFPAIDAMKWIKL